MVRVVRDYHYFIPCTLSSRHFFDLEKNQFVYHTVSIPVKNSIMVGDIPICFPLLKSR